jgi:flagellar basal body-associated protein FliL
MLKILLVVLIVILAMAACIGGTLGVTEYLHHASATVASGQAPKPPPPAPKPLYFSTLTDITVSIPPQAGAAATSYVEFSVQLSTYDQAALVTFEDLQPIIKAAVITLLMNETSQSLQDPQTRVDLTKSCLHIANDVLARNASFSPPSPFGAAYITNLVVQD